MCDPAEDSDAGDDDRRDEAADDARVPLLRLAARVEALHHLEDLVAREQAIGVDVCGQEHLVDPAGGRARVWACEVSERCMGEGG